MPPDDSPTTPMTASGWPLCSIGLAVVSFALLQAITCRESLWLDELHTAWTVAAPWAEVVERAQAGNSPPLFFWLTALVTRIAGMSEPALRFVSWLSMVMFMILLSVVTWRCSRSIMLGVLVVALIGFDPHCLFYARESRPYALLLLTGTFQIHFFWRRLGDPSPRTRVGWIVTTWLIFYCHYTGILIVVGELAYVACIIRSMAKTQDRVWRTWASDLAIVSLGLLPAAWHVSQVGMRRENWSQFVTPQPIYTTLTIFNCGLYVLQISAWTWLLLLVAWQRGVVRTVWNWREYGRKAGLLTCLYLGPVMLGWLLTSAGIAPLFFRRYLLLAQIPLFLHVILIGACFKAPRWQGMFAAGAMGLVLINAAMQPRSIWTHHAHEDWRSLVATLRDEAARDTRPIVLRAGLIEDAALADDPSTELIEYCRFPLTSAYDVGVPASRIEPVPSQTAPLPATTLQRMLGEGGAWIVVRGTPATFRAQWNHWTRQWKSAGVAPMQRRTVEFEGLHLIRVTVATPRRDAR